MFVVTLETDAVNEVRQIYTIWDVLGDIGGLLRACFVIGQVVVYPFSAYALRMNILTKVFREKVKKGYRKKLPIIVHHVMEVKSAIETPPLLQMLPFYWPGALFTCRV